jgi:hypothetical protein
MLRCNILELPDIYQYIGHFSIFSFYLLHCKKSSAAMQRVRVRSMFMATARFLKRQAVKCAALAKQTQDGESRQRWLRLEQSYRQLAESEDRRSSHDSAVAGEHASETAA